MTIDAPVPVEGENARPPVSDPELARLVSTLHDDADPLHVDLTPSVHALVRRGIAGGLAVVELLAAPDEMTRLRAQRVVEGAASVYHGWIPGLGLADGSLGEERVRALLEANGGYRHDAPPAVRREAVRRWRRWFEERVMPADTTRVRGELRGRFRAARAHLSAGQPIWVDLEIENTGERALEFDNGGDYRGSFVHARFGFRVDDSSGRTLCDTAREPLRNLGGLGQRTVVPPGGAYRERLLLNPACEALVGPGRYRVVITRVFTIDDALPTGCEAQSPADPTDIDASTERHDASCLAALRALPAITTEMAIEVFPYDRARLEATLRTELGEVTAGVDSGYRTWAFQWVCRRLRCDCPELTDTSNEGVVLWMTNIASALPSSVRDGACTGP